MFVLFTACACLAAAHSITRDLLAGPTPDLFSELEGMTFDESDPVPFKNCGSASDLVSISSLSLSPLPAKKGANVSTLISGTLNKGFNSGQWKVTVQSGIIKKTVSGDICEELKQKGKSCPVAAGPVNFNHDEAIPAIAPSGTYHITSVSTADAGQLFCIQFDMPIQDELDASPVCRKCVERVSEVVMKHTVEGIVETCRKATDPAVKAKCEFMRTHQNFTFGMLVEEVKPVNDAAFYCMGAHFCRAGELQLDAGDSTETELAELGDMLKDIVGSRPAPGVFTSAAENCSTCVDSGDKAVMQDVVAKVPLVCGRRTFRLPTVTHCNRSRTSALTPQIPKRNRCLLLDCSHIFETGFAFSTRGTLHSLAPTALRLGCCPSRIHPWFPVCQGQSLGVLRRFVSRATLCACVFLTLQSSGECVQQKLCPDPYTAAASRTGIDVASTLEF